MKLVAEAPAKKNTMPFSAKLSVLCTASAKHGSIQYSSKSRRLTFNLPFGKVGSYAAAASTAFRQSCVAKQSEVG